MKKTKQKLNHGHFSIKRKNYLPVSVLIFSLVFFSCRKKDERYEGYYTGNERFAEKDSGETVYAVDSTYHQEIDVTYSNKIYQFEKMVPQPDYSSVFTIGKESIIDHTYTSFGEIYYDSEGNEIGSAGNLKFVGDSLYINSWSSFNGDEQILEFKGKRN